MTWAFFINNLFCIAVCLIKKVNSPINNYTLNLCFHRY